MLNQICQLGQIPQCFKHGVIIPAFKGKGRDPLLKKNYRGINLTTVTVFANVLDIILIERISLILDEAGIPQATQTAYKKGVTCPASIFAGQEANMRNSLTRVILCTYGFTFLPVLLTRQC